MNCFCGAKLVKMPNPLPVWHGIQMSLWQCVDCRHVTVMPVPMSSQLCVYYQTEYEHSKRGYLDEMIVKDAQARIIGGVRSIHDYGCGDGYHLEQIWKSNSLLALTGYDPNPDSVRKARERGLWGVWIDPAIHAHADLVTMNHCLEHSASPIATLVHASNSLAPTGRMIIRVPNANFGHTLDDFTKWIWFGIPWHLNYFTPMSLRRAVSIAGLYPESWNCTPYREQAPAEMLDQLMKDMSAEELVLVAGRAT